MAKKIKQIIWPSWDSEGKLNTQINISEQIFYIGIQAFPGTVLDFGAAGTLTINSTGIFEFNVPDNMVINSLAIDLSNFVNLSDGQQKVNRQVIIDYLGEGE